MVEPFINQKVYLRNESAPPGHVSESELAVFAQIRSAPGKPPRSPEYLDAERNR